VIRSVCGALIDSITCCSGKQAFIVLSNDLTRFSSESDLNEFPIKVKYSN
jgi:hypothetical protein